ncbi:MAG: hypothetical protein ACK4EY_14555 [Flavipsychrobacter sp.]
MTPQERKEIGKERLPPSVQNLPIYTDAERAAIDLALQEMDALQDEMLAAKFAGNAAKVQALKEPLLKAIKRVEASLGTAPEIIS